MLNLVAINAHLNYLYVMNFNDLKTPEELMQFLQDKINYGFVADNVTYKYPIKEEDIHQHYKIRLGEDLIDTGYGVCWDITELQRKFFENAGIKHECYFLQAYKKDNIARPIHTHAFLIYHEDNQWKWFEYSFSQHRGIHENYKTKQELLNDVATKFLARHERENYYDLHKYPRVTKALTANQFIKHCTR